MKTLNDLLNHLEKELSSKSLEPIIITTNEDYSFSVLLQAFEILKNHYPIKLVPAPSRLVFSLRPGQIRTLDGDRETLTQEIQDQINLGQEIRIEKRTNEQSKKVEYFLHFLTARGYNRISLDEMTGKKFSSENNIQEIKKFIEDQKGIFNAIATVNLTEIPHHDFSVVQTLKKLQKTVGNAQKKLSIPDPFAPPTPKNLFDIEFDIQNLSLINDSKDLMAALSACLLIDSKGHPYAIDSAKRLSVLTNYVLKLNEKLDLVGIQHLQEKQGGTLVLSSETWYRTAPENHPQSYDAIGLLNPNKVLVLLDRFDEAENFQGSALPGGIGENLPNLSVKEARKNAAVTMTNQKLTAISGFPISQLTEKEKTSLASFSENVVDTSYITHQMIPTEETLKELFDNGRIGKKVFDFYQYLSNDAKPQHKLQTSDSLGLVISTIFYLEIPEERLFQCVVNDQRRSKLVKEISLRATIVGIIDSLFPQRYAYRHEFYQGILPFLFQSLDKKPSDFKNYLCQANHRIMEVMLADILRNRFPVQINRSWSSEKIFAEWSKHIAINFMDYLTHSPTLNVDDYCKGLGFASFQELFTFSQEMKQIVLSYQEKFVPLIKKEKLNGSNDPNIIASVPRVSHSASTRLDLLVDFFSKEEFKITDQLFIADDGKIYSKTAWNKFLKHYRGISPFNRENLSPTDPYRYLALENYIKSPTNTTLKELCTDPISKEIMEIPVVLTFTSTNQLGDKVGQTYAVIVDSSTIDIIQDPNHQSSKIYKKSLAGFGIKTIPQLRVEFSELQTFIYAHKEKLSEVSYQSTPFIPVDPKNFGGNNAPIKRALTTLPACKILITNEKSLNNNQEYAVACGQEIWLINKMGRSWEIYFRLQRGVTRIDTIDAKDFPIQENELTQQNPLWQKLVTEIIVPNGGCYPAQAITLQPQAQDKSLLELIQMRKRVPFDIGFSIENAFIDCPAALIAALSACLKVNDKNEIIGIDSEKRRQVIEKFVLEKNSVGKVVGTKIIPRTNAGTIAITTLSNRLTNPRQDLHEVARLSDHLNHLSPNLRLLVLERFTGESKTWDGFGLPGGIGGNTCREAAAQNTLKKLRDICNNTHLHFTLYEIQTMQCISEGVPDFSYPCNAVIPDDKELEKLLAENRISQRVYSYLKNFPRKLPQNQRNRDTLSMVISDTFLMEVDENTFNLLVPSDQNFSPEFYSKTNKRIEVRFRARIVTLVEILRPSLWKYQHEFYGNILLILYRYLNKNLNHFEEYLKQAQEGISQWMINDFFENMYPSQVSLKDDWSDAEILATWRNLIMINILQYCFNYGIPLEAYNQNFSSEALVNLAKKLKDHFVNASKALSGAQFNRRISTDSNLIVSSTQICEKFNENSFENLVAKLAPVTKQPIQELQENFSLFSLTSSKPLPNQAQTRDDNNFSSIKLPNKDAKKVQFLRRIVVEEIELNEKGEPVAIKTISREEIEEADGQVDYRGTTVTKNVFTGETQKEFYQGTTLRSIFQPLNQTCTIKEATDNLIPLLGDGRNGDSNRPAQNQLTERAIKNWISPLNAEDKAQVLLQLDRYIEKNRSHLYTVPRSTFDSLFSRTPISVHEENQRELIARITKNLQLTTSTNIKFLE